MRISNYLIGSDIEVFLKDSTSNKFISAAGDATSRYRPLLPGTKHDPHWINEEKTFAVETDNVSVEFLIPPTTDKENFINSIEFMLDYIKMSISDNLEICPIGSAIFEDNQLKTKQARKFGCEPDINAWTGRENNLIVTNPNLRSNGFHIHIGYDNPDRGTSYELVKVMDLFAGLFSLQVDPDTQRRSLYGKAGSCRLKPYGVEYRVLSSYLISDKEYIGKVFDCVLEAIEFINSGNGIPDDVGQLVQDAINNNNLNNLEKIQEYVRTSRIFRI